MRQIIVNADDFGLCASVNRGIATAHDRGIVTSASLMVRRDGAEAATAMARARPRLSLGLHLDLAEWKWDGDRWVPVYQVVDPDDERALHTEVGRQIERFRDLCGADPTHLDSHQHVHRSEPCASVVAEFGATLDVPVRDRSRRIRYSGEFYGQTGRGEPFLDAITVPAMIGIIHRLRVGVTELGCHPADGSLVDSVYAAERNIELSVLCDPEVRRAIDESGVSLVSFADVRA